MPVSPRRYRLIRRAAIALAALPLLQASACQTGFNMIATDAINSLPAAIFNILLNAALAPIFALLTGNSDLTGLGGQGGGFGGGI